MGYFFQFKNLKLVNFKNQMNLHIALFFIIFDTIFFIKLVFFHEDNNLFFYFFLYISI